MILIANNDRAESIVRNGRPGDAYVYYVGDLGSARKVGKLETPAASIARCMRRLYEHGLVDLVQRRLEPGIFEYIAIRKKPWVRRF